MAIDFSTLTEANFNGTALTEINYNSTSVWTQPSAGGGFPTGVARRAGTYDIADTTPIVPIDGGLVFTDMVWTPKQGYQGAPFMRTNGILGDPSASVQQTMAYNHYDWNIFLQILNEDNVVEVYAQTGQNSADMWINLPRGDRQTKPSELHKTGDSSVLFPTTGNIKLFNVGDVRQMTVSDYPLPTYNSHTQGENLGQTHKFWDNKTYHDLSHFTPGYHKVGGSTSQSAIEQLWKIGEFDADGSFILDDTLKNGHAWTLKWFWEWDGQYGLETRSRSLTIQRATDNPNWAPGAGANDFMMGGKIYTVPVNGNLPLITDMTTQYYSRPIVGGNLQPPTQGGYGAYTLPGGTRFEMIDKKSYFWEGDYPSLKVPYMELP